MVCGWIVSHNIVDQLWTRSRSDKCRIMFDGYTMHLRGIIMAILSQLDFHFTQNCYESVKSHRKCFSFKLATDTFSCLPTLVHVAMPCFAPGGPTEQVCNDLDFL